MYKRQVIDSTYYYRSTLFLSDMLPIADSFEAYTLDSNPYAASNTVFNNTGVKDEEWYRETTARTAYVFTNEATDEFCIARKIINNYYICLLYTSRPWRFWFQTKDS